MTNKDTIIEALTMELRLEREGNLALAKRIDELRQALAEPANSTTDFVEPKASSQTEQEPVCFLRETSWSYEIAPWDDPNGIPVYTAPPIREWVGLTDADIAQTMHGSVEGSNMLPYQFARAIEQALKEKNGG